MTAELRITFPSPNRVVITLVDSNAAGCEHPFKNPLPPGAFRDIKWYVETYGANSLGDPDDQQALRISRELPKWGTLLFDAVFQDQCAAACVEDLRKAHSDSRFITIASESPEILRLPWELLCDPKSCNRFMFAGDAPISIKRTTLGGNICSSGFQPKQTLHVLFVVSRPSGVGFIDPRSDASAVLDAIDGTAHGRISCEFLRPPTRRALEERLGDKSKTAIDVIHFDGHGVLDDSGLITGDCKLANTGYLLFETQLRSSDYVSAQDFSKLVANQGIKLVVLSACQSAAVAATDNDPLTESDTGMGSVASQLTRAAVPFVLAMTYSVLVATTRKLFASFYQELAKGHSVGEALDVARTHLFEQPQKHQVQRGSTTVDLTLFDWFVPVLYERAQTGSGLLTPDGSPGEPRRYKTNVATIDPKGFFGRSYELLEIERLFSTSTRLIAITGFGGQGKTTLAAEAAHWLLRTAMFDSAVSIDFSRAPVEDTVSVVATTLGSVLGQTVADEASIEEAILKVPTLFVFDNLESLTETSLNTLLDVATKWSRIGESRVLCTTRKPDLHFKDRYTSESIQYRRMRLEGLGTRQYPNDALEYLAHLFVTDSIPTTYKYNRTDLLDLLETVQFHPLSIKILARQLGSVSPHSLTKWLDTIIIQEQETDLSADDKVDKPPLGLIASVNLSLQQLTKDARIAVSRLGVFKTGAFEEDLLRITGMTTSLDEILGLRGFVSAVEAGNSESYFAMAEVPHPNAESLSGLLASAKSRLLKLTKISTNVWPSLRRELESGGLIEAHRISGVRKTYIKFHPTLAPILWASLEEEERRELTIAHYRRYYGLISELTKVEASRALETRALVWEDLSNYRAAIRAAFEFNDPERLGFSNLLHTYYIYFGFTQEAKHLADLAENQSDRNGTRISHAALSTRGEHLFKTGDATGAIETFKTVLLGLGLMPSLEVANAQLKLGRCYTAQGRPDLAVAMFEDALRTCASLNQDDEIAKLRSSLWADYGDALRDQGDFDGARQYYDRSLAAKLSDGDLRGVAVARSQMGTLLIMQGNAPGAIQFLQESVAAFENLNEPVTTAGVIHQLAIAYRDSNRWEDAELLLRKTAMLLEAAGDLAGVAKAWDSIGVMAAKTGKPQLAESWFTKAIERSRDVGDLLSLSNALANFAFLLLSFPDRLKEARSKADESLAIKKTLDPASSEIWQTYGLLGQIVLVQAGTCADAREFLHLQAEAHQYNRDSRGSLRRIPGAPHHLRRASTLIFNSIAAANDTTLRGQFEVELVSLEQVFGRNLILSIHNILDGLRDVDQLCERLAPHAAVVVEAIIQGLADPSALDGLTLDD